MSLLIIRSILLLKISILLSCSFLYAASESDKIKDLARKVEKDSLIHELFHEQIEREGRHIERNKTIVKKLDSDLEAAMQLGKMEDEICIRRYINALRTINYIYDWLLDQIEEMKSKKIRLVMLNDLERIRYLNKRFSSMNMEIEECKLKNRSRGSDERELYKDIADTKIETVNRRIDIPEEFKSARTPYK